MTPKQRLLAALRGESTDRVPWSPFLAYWLDFQPQEIKEKPQLQIMQEMGADPLVRGFDPTNARGNNIRMYDTIYHNCSINESVDSNEKIVNIKTPKGALQAKYIISPQGNTWFLREHPIKKQSDYTIVKCLFDNIELIANYKEYDVLSDKVGDEALIIPLLLPGITAKSGFQSMVEFWVGTQELAYAVMDIPEEIDDLLMSIRRVDKMAAQICSKSKAEIFLTWEDTSTTNISPSNYEKYILPQLNEWSLILQKEGKMYMQHACGHLKNLMPLMGASQVNGIESISPPPTGNITMKDARAILPKDKFLVGGIEPTIFLNSTMKELEVYTKSLIAEMKGYPFVLANSDSCPPCVDYEKFLMISRIVRNEL